MRRRALITACVCLAGYAAMVIVRLGVNGWDASIFVCAGEPTCDPSATPPGLAVREGAGGFDGQYFYRFARNPFTNRKTEDGILLDVPAYRHQRVGYPLLGWAVSGGGKSHILPWAMIGINLAWIWVIGYIGGLLCVHFRLNWIYGLLPALWPGLMFSVARDLSEVQASAMLLVAIYLLMRERFALSAILLCGAVLTRETSIVAAVAILLFLGGKFVRDRKMMNLRNAAWFILPMVVLASWQGMLRWVWGQWPHGGHSGEVISPVPLAGLVAFIRSGAPFRQIAESSVGHDLSAGGVNSMYWLFSAGSLAVFVVFGVMTFIAMFKSRTDFSVKITWLFIAGVCSMLSASSLSYGPSGFMRQAAEMSICGSVIILGAAKPFRVIAMIILGVAWAAYLPYCIVMP